MNSYLQRPSSISETTGSKEALGYRFCIRLVKESVGPLADGGEWAKFGISGCYLTYVWKRRLKVQGRFSGKVFE